ncbi:MAG: hypothetical protein ACYDH6_20070 [Acidimicrobiales bacterium]
MPAERSPSGGHLVGVAALGVALCCGLPLLLSLAAGVVIAGIALRSWLLALAVVAAVGSGAAWRHRRRAECDVTSDYTGRA